MVPFFAQLKTIPLAPATNSIPLVQSMSTAIVEMWLNKWPVAFSTDFLTHLDEIVQSPDWVFIYNNLNWVTEQIAKLQTGALVPII